MITDCAIVMARVAGSTLSARTTNHNPCWLRCGAHQLNKPMKGCISSLQHADYIELRRILEDLNRVKTIERVFKQSGFNIKLGNCYHLIQEIELDFQLRTPCSRVKSLEWVEDLVDEPRIAAVKEAFEQLLT